MLLESLATGSRFIRFDAKRTTGGSWYRILIDKPDSSRPGARRVRPPMATAPTDCARVASRRATVRGISRELLWDGFNGVGKAQGLLSTQSSRLSRAGIAQKQPVSSTANCAGYVKPYRSCVTKRLLSQELPAFFVLTNNTSG